MAAAMAVVVTTVVTVVVTVVVTAGMMVMAGVVAEEAGKCMIQK